MRQRNMTNCVPGQGGWETLYLHNAAKYSSYELYPTLTLSRGNLPSATGAVPLHTCSQFYSGAQPPFFYQCPTTDITISQVALLEGIPPAHLSFGKEYIKHEQEPTKLSSFIISY